MMNRFELFCGKVKVDLSKQITYSDVKIVMIFNETSLSGPKSLEQPRIHVFPRSGCVRASEHLKRYGSSPTRRNVGVWWAIIKIPTSHS